jgi:hypothetical protein
VGAAGRCGVGQPITMTSQFESAAKAWKVEHPPDLWACFAGLQSTVFVTWLSGEHAHVRPFRIVCLGGLCLLAATVDGLRSPARPRWLEQRHDLDEQLTGRAVHGARRFEASLGTSVAAMNCQDSTVPLAPCCHGANGECYLRSSVLICGSFPLATRCAPRGAPIWACPIFLTVPRRL